MNSNTDARFMLRAIELARKAEGHTAPNPLVGCVIVHEGRIIGEGYHRAYGEPHAEVNAIASVIDSTILKESTLYVTLEPCAHFGKTPPCSNLIIEKGIPKVVVGCRDPFEAVNGKGIEQLRKAGVEVITDFMLEECRHVNRRFFTFHEKKRPHVLLKWAQSSDGFMDIDRSEPTKGSFMISHPDTQALVHAWRAEEAAILIGKNTLLNDNPSLTVRRVTGKNPIRIVLSANPIDLSGYHLSDSQAPTWVITNEPPRAEGSIRHLACGNVHSIERVLNCLYEQGVLSVMVEGGAQILHAFLESGLWDEARVIHADKELGSGLPAPSVPAPCTREEVSASDRILYYYKQS